MDELHGTRPLDERSVTPGDPWGPVEVFDSLGSTNDEVRARPRLWRVVVAEVQDAGRGRGDLSGHEDAGLGTGHPVLLRERG